MRDHPVEARAQGSGPPLSVLRRLLVLPLVVLATLLATSCGRLGQLAEPFRPQTPHERYSTSLREAGLASTALGRDWLAAAERALRTPQTASLPFREKGYFPADEVHALAFKFSLQRGQRLVVQMSVDGVEPPVIFLDLYELPDDATGAPLHRASADSGTLTLDWEPERDAGYLLRLQPELLRSARYTIILRSQAVLGFPVGSRDSRAIGSGFGAERDGGRRVHHGIDIFAPRGAPVLAAAGGVVTRVEETSLGGRVVWVHDLKRGQNHYYAHLDRQSVRPGARVEVGDTLGTVGNTGNARNTPPHLHFGIYRRGEGPIDPQPWVHTSTLPLPELAVSTEPLGTWRRARAREIPLHSEPSARAGSHGVVARHAPLRVMGASGTWYRILLPDGRSGYVAARSTESLARPLRQHRLAGAAALQDRPLPHATVIDTLPSGSAVPVLGSFAGFLLVEGSNGRPGWLAE